ncbi:MAG: hypothetical protein ACI8UD_004065 [Planctomycetota bacterium]|jgi:hypothetical protein
MAHSARLKSPVRAVDLSQMRKILLVALGALACCLTSCGSINSVRWAYGEESAFAESSPPTSQSPLRPAFGLPVIVGGVLFDAVTWPAQLAFGVWPWWGNNSKHMKPTGD